MIMAHATILAISARQVHLINKEIPFMKIGIIGAMEQEVAIHPLWALLSGSRKEER